MRALKAFLATEASSGMFLLLAALAGMLVANSPAYPEYQAWLATPLGVTVGEGGMVKSLAHWINDGLMALFFLLIGLEIKRELYEGELASLSKALLPVIAALGGVVVPALIYLHFNGETEAARGWAIASATDIAFSLAVLALLGSRLPMALKIFLMSVAVIDDLIAVVIIAMFYTDALVMDALVKAACIVVVLLALNALSVCRLAPYMLLGALLWYYTLHSGVHATIAGVVLGMVIPVRVDRRRGNPPAPRLERMLHPWVAYGIMPLFAFANAGVPLEGVTLATLTNPLPLGIMLGLFVGKQLGIFASAYLAVRSGLARMPTGVGWPEFYAVGIIAGIGFTMSLFIGALAFTEESLMNEVRLGVLAGSLCSALVGGTMLWLILRHRYRRGRSLGI